MDQNGLGNNRNTIPDIYAGANDKPKKKNAKEIFMLLSKLKSKKRAILYATHNRELSNRADYKLNILDGNITKKK